MRITLVFVVMVWCLGCRGDANLDKKTNSNPPAQAAPMDEPEYKGKGVSDWLRELTAEDPRTRGSAVRALGKIGIKSDKVVPALIKATKDADGRVRNEAVDQIGRIGAPAKDAVPALIVTLKDKDEDTRWDSAEALEAMGPAAKDAVPALLEALKDSSGNVRRHAATALKKIDPDAAKKAGIQ